MSKGSTCENELRAWAWEHGYAPLRAPGSGTIDSPSPDVVLISGNRRGPTDAHAIELKNRPNGTASFENSEIKELIEWSSKAGAKPWVVIKPDQRKKEHDSWYCLRVGQLHETPSGNYSIRKQDLETCMSRSEAFL